MDTKEKALTLLENFKELLKWWASGRGTTTTRSEINKNLQAVRKLLQETGTSKTVTISPPPMIGGPLHLVVSFFLSFYTKKGIISVTV